MKWHNVQREKPEVAGTYLCYSTQLKDEVFLCRYEPREEIFFDFYGHVRVTHWMSIPPKPELP